jgi:hypothetical protein
MDNHFYVTAVPESLVASHLPALEFGNYLATGTRKRTRGQAIFFEIDPDRVKNVPWEYVQRRLVPYPNGEPKRSVYLSIYRVLENTPLDALKNLYLVTDDGKVLGIEAGTYKEKQDDEIHLYQQFNPITTRVASKLTPPEFVRFLSDPSKPVFAPRVFFVEMHLGKLAKDPQAPLHNRPYPNPDHLRDCLQRLMNSPERQTKTVLRSFNGELSYRCVKDGFFIGDQINYKYYPMPSIEDLEDKYYSWWRSALVQCF